jgi:hypothetical protein
MIPGAATPGLFFRVAGIAFGVALALALPFLLGWDPTDTLGDGAGYVLFLMTSVLVTGSSFAFTYASWTQPPRLATEAPFPVRLLYGLSVAALSAFSLLSAFATLMVILRVH